MDLASAERRHEGGAFRPLIVERSGVVARGEILGDGGRPTVLFVHGYSQAGSCWNAQFDSDLADKLCLARYDLRGHANSDKPMDASAYSLDGFADELDGAIDAVIAEMDPSCLVLCAWSFGARIALRLLAERGRHRLGGLVLVGAAPSDDPALLGPGLRHKGAMFSDQLDQNEAATRCFLQSCFVSLPTEEDFERLVSENMRVPPFVRSAMSGHPLHADGLGDRLEMAILVAHGSEDQVVLVSAAHRSAELFEGAHLSLYKNVGHAPFMEDPQRFNRELLAFCQDVGSG